MFPHLGTYLHLLTPQVESPAQQPEPQTQTHDQTQADTECLTLDQTQPHTQTQTQTSQACAQNDGEIQAHAQAQAQDQFHCESLAQLQFPSQTRQSQDQDQSQASGSRDQSQAQCDKYITKALSPLWSKEQEEEFEDFRKSECKRIEEIEKIESAQLQAQAQAEPQQQAQTLTQTRQSQDKDLPMKAHGNGLNCKGICDFCEINQCGRTRHSEREDHYCQDCLQLNEKKDQDLFHYKSLAQAQDQFHYESLFQSRQSQDLPQDQAQFSDSQDSNTMSSNEWADLLRPLEIDLNRPASEQQNDDLLLKHLLKEIQEQSESDEENTAKNTARNTETESRSAGNTTRKIARTLGGKVSRNITCELGLAKFNSKISSAYLAPVGSDWDTLLANANNIIETVCARFQPAMYKIGICASPLQRFTHPDIGYAQDGYIMVLLAASVSTEIAALEINLIKAHKGSEGCMNIAKGGEGRGPPDTGSFLYVVVKQSAGDPAPLPSSKKRKKNI